MSRTTFRILNPDLHYVQKFPIGGRGYLANYGQIKDVDPFDGKKHTMEEMVNGILRHDPLLELLCSFKPADGYRMADIITKYVTRVIPRDKVSDLPEGADFEFASVQKNPYLR